MLVDIALGHGPFVANDTQVAAIDQLAKRNDPEVAVAVANLLQPHEGLVTRQAAAVALQSLPCDERCVGSILYYLERAWRGEPNYEDRIVRPRSFQEVATSLKSDQQSLYGNLYKILRRNKAQTLANLVNFQGIASDAPSLFALDLTSRLGLHDSCQLLSQTDRAIQRHSIESYKAPRQELQTAITSLDCK